MVGAQVRATELGHHHIRSGHVLVALAAAPETSAGRVLSARELTAEGLQEDLARLAPPDVGAHHGPLSFSPGCKEVLGRALAWADRLNDASVGTEHLLIGLLQGGTGTAVAVLDGRGVRSDQLVVEVMQDVRVQGGDGSGRPATPPTTGATQVLMRASIAAGEGPVGTQHLLVELARTEGSLAARVLASFGLDHAALAARVDELGTAGTSDHTPTLS